VPVALRRAFDHVVANPPYLRAGGGTPAADAGRDAALREATPLAGWIVAARRRLRPGGTLTVIQAAERLPDLLGALSGAGFGTVVVLPVAPRRGRSAVRAIVTARKGGRGAFSLAAPFVLHAAPAHAGDREDLTPEAAAVLRGGAALVPDG
jgi:tRNA1(Val) A37 N6-methylase TrmN6